MNEPCPTCGLTTSLFHEQHRYTETEEDESFPGLAQNHEDHEPIIKFPLGWLKGIPCLVCGTLVVTDFSGRWVHYEEEKNCPPQLSSLRKENMTNWDLIVEYMEHGPEAAISGEEFQRLLSDELNEEN